MPTIPDLCIEIMAEMGGWMGPSNALFIKVTKFSFCCHRIWDAYMYLYLHLVLQSAYSTIKVPQQCQIQEFQISPSQGYTKRKCMLSSSLLGFYPAIYLKLLKKVR